MDFQLYPATRRKCYRCRKYGHYASFCLTKDKYGIYNIEEHSDAGSEDSFRSAASVSSTQRLTELENNLAESKRQITSLMQENVELKKQTDTLRMSDQKLTDVCEKL